MSEYNICLIPSTLARKLLWLVLPLPLVLLLANPEAINYWLVVAPVLVGYYFVWLSYHQGLNAQGKQLATLNSDGEICWFAPKNATGRLKQGGLVSQYVLRINWYSDKQQALLQQWVFADQCQPEAFSALARQITQTNWLTSQASTSSQ